ncbi:hypothetical protein AB0I28_39130 [Phytomonospora sp. NPDC050363]|uniref:hypothetical protein n=1 Tax=Phytomonospora sp. NPDC050363 TaxID=3155642 RepID=UPI0033D31DF0
MPRHHLRTATAALLTSALLAGCSSVPPQLKAPVGLYFTADDADCDDESFAAGDGELIGPHFAIEVSCVRFAASPADLRSGDERPLPAPPGYEYAVIEFASSPPASPTWDDREPVASLAFEESETVFDELPGHGDTVVAVVPSEGSVLLTVADEGRAQAIDLRERTRVDAVDGYYQGVEGSRDTPGYSMRAEGESGGWKGWYELDGDIVVARSLWSPGAGWAAEGRAVLTVSVWWTRLDKDIETYFDLDPKSSMKISSGGQHYSPEEIGEADANVADILFSYTYDVPADAVEFAVNFTPRGKLTITDGNRPLKVTKAPKANKFTVDFGRE